MISYSKRHPRCRSGTYHNNTTTVRLGNTTINHEHHSIRAPKRTKDGVGYIVSGSRSFRPTGYFSLASKERLSCCSASFRFDVAVACGATAVLDRFPLVCGVTVGRLAWVVRWAGAERRFFVVLVVLLSPAGRSGGGTMKVSKTPLLCHKPLRQKKRERNMCNCSQQSTAKIREVAHNHIFSYCNLCGSSTDFWKWEAIISDVSFFCTTFYRSSYLCVSCK